jgi:uncharacterized repeat protein (TIGR01451 family)
VDQSTPAGDVAWVAATPVAGTLPGGSGIEVTLIYTVPEQVHDTYSATLRISSNDPLTPVVDVPLTMTVVLPPHLSIIKQPSAERVETGSLLTYTLTVSNTGGPLSGVAVSDTLSPEIVVAWASDGGTLIGDELVWNELHLAQGAGLALHYGVTVTCVPSGTPIVNNDYRVKAMGWPPPVQGQPVTVTATAEDVVAAFEASWPILRQDPVSFTNLSQNAAAFLWSFGDGLFSDLHSPVHTYAERGTYTTVLTASNPCTADEYRRTLSVEDLSVALAPSRATARAAPGQTTIYTFSLTNTGTLSDSFTLALDGSLWDTALSSEVVGPLAPGTSGAVQVRVSVPPGTALGASDQVTLQATSNGDPRQPPASAISLLTITAQPYVRYLPLVCR